MDNLTPDGSLDTWITQSGADHARMYRQALLKLKATWGRPVKWAPALASIAALIIALGAFFADAADTKSRLNAEARRR
jgi:hypothetical protein